MKKEEDNELESKIKKNSFLKNIDFNSDKPTIAICKAPFHAGVVSFEKDENGKYQISYRDQGGHKINPFQNDGKARDVGIKYKEYKCSNNQCVDASMAIANDIIENGIKGSEEKHSKDSKNSNAIDNGPEKNPLTFKLKYLLLIPFIIDLYKKLKESGKAIPEGEVKNLSEKSKSPKSKVNMLEEVANFNDIIEAQKILNEVNKENELKKLNSKDNITIYNQKNLTNENEKISEKEKTNKLSSLSNITKPSNQKQTIISGKQKNNEKSLIK